MEFQVKQVQEEKRVLKVLVEKKGLLVYLEALECREPRGP